MAKTKNKAKAKKAPHARVVCPRCGKSVALQLPTRFQQSLPCPACRVPISAALIEGALAQAASDKALDAAEATGGDGAAGATAAEAAPATAGAKATGSPSATEATQE